jgi:hypothetical protein
MDDELNILPISTHVRSITPVPVNEVTFGSFNFMVWKKIEILMMFSVFVSSSSKTAEILFYHPVLCMIDCVVGYSLH